MYGSKTNCQIKVQKADRNDGDDLDDGNDDGDVCVRYALQRLPRHLLLASSSVNDNDRDAAMKEL